MKLDKVIARLRAGDQLRVQFADGKRVWWFEDPHQNVPDAVAMQAVNAANVVGAGDSLFGLPMNSQTWLVDDVGGGP